MMMLIDGAPRLSLTRIKRGQKIRSDGSSHKNILNRRKNKRPNTKRIKKKRVRFDLIEKTSVRYFPKVSNEEGKDIWHSKYEYALFVLNWKLYPNEPMKPRSFLHSLWQIKDTPETMRMEDHQSFQPEAKDERQKTRECLLDAYEPGATKHDQLAQLSISMTAKHRDQARLCGSLNEKEVEADQEQAPSVEEVRRRDPPIAPKDRQPKDEQADALSFLSQYVDSIVEDWDRAAALWSEGCASDVKQ